MAKKCCCKKGCSCVDEINNLQTQIDDVCEGVRTIYRYIPPVESGLNYRFWDSTHGPHLDPLEWEGPADFNGFPLPTASAPTFSGISNATSISDAGESNPNIAARYGIIDGWIYLPEGTTNLRDNNSNTGELGMVLTAGCCGGSLTEQPGGNHTVNTGTADRGLMDSTPFGEGWYKIYSPHSDLSAFSGLDLEYSTNGGASWSEVTVQQPTIPRVECQEISACDPIPEGWGIKALQECCEGNYSIGGGLSEDEVLALIPPPIEPCDDNPISDNNHSDGNWSRVADAGESEEYARCDHKHPIVRIPNPGDPLPVYSGQGTLDASLILDRLSTEESYMYKFRLLVSQDAGTGWGFITLPTIAGFQQPKITGIGTYRFASTAVQEDDGTFGASPRGPYMGKEAHEWSSTRRVYMGYFRRDNAHRTYVEFWVEYIRT